MKKKAFPLLCVLLLVSTVVFAALWRQEAARNEDTPRRMWLSAASSGENIVTEYRQAGLEIPYCQVISELLVMERALLLAEGTGPDYTDLNAVYGILSLYPERCPDVTEELLLVFQTASQEELDGSNWPLRVNELRNILEYGR